MVASLDDATGVSYQDLMEMPYEETLRLNLDVRAHVEAKKDALEEKYET